MENAKAKNFHISRFFTKSAIEAMEEACRMGASERKSCEDAVSRRAVLDTLDKMDSVLDEDRTVETYKELLIACYNDLPPVTPVRKEERWIPCSERLPEEGKPVLVSGYNTYGKEVTIASYQGEQYGFTCGLVSAWMRLPEPYKAEMVRMQNG